MEFSQVTIEQLGYYVYALQNPQDGRIFYVGKGKGNRIFAHVSDALESATESDKLETIRRIRHVGLEVEHFIIRHGLDENTAYAIESTVIDLLTFKEPSQLSDLKNIQSGHHAWDRGVRTVSEIEALYAAKPITDAEVVHPVMIININRTYKRGTSPYEATRKYWKLNPRKVKTIKYVISEYRGIFRAIYQPMQWHESDDHKRWYFEGVEVTDQTIKALYLNRAYKGKKRGQANPIRYVFPQAGE